MEQLDLFSQAPTITADRYHNTVPLSGADLKAREMRAQAQGRKILDYFRKHPYSSFTPYDILRAFDLPERLIVSVRRSITNLTQCKEHYLVMTGNKKREVCGDFNNMWQINHNADQNLYTLTLE
jgi:hypothetical protein